MPYGDTVVAILAGSAFAGGVPPQAMNKTITISFTATGRSGNAFAG
jgi:hypothetical protein